MKSSGLIVCLVLVLLLAAGSGTFLFARSGKTARIAVTQPRNIEWQDPFSSEYDPARIRPQCQENLENNFRLFERAGELGADLVCGPEDIQHIGPYLLYLETTDPETGELLFTSLAEPIPGPISRRVSEIAHKYRMYIIAPMFEREGEKVYNTALVVDRNGEIIGKHRKTHLPVMETWVVSRGDEYKVFTTDFAKIAIATCYEVTYPEICALYALKGAELIFNPTGGKENDGPLATAHRYLTRAKDNSVYLAPVAYGEDGSGIIDFNSKVVAEAVGVTDTVIMAEIDFSRDRTNSSEWWRNINGTDNIRAMRLLLRRPETYKLLTEPNPLLLERYPDVRLTTGDRKRQLKALKAVDYSPKGDTRR
ncbi:MAG: carbon-nitrogen hydrolase family protein [Candidatus Glassbacteria bacterium]|nr:carbon-nitrogen hydrolase family protein [Candidatus Glassbacteria bacterium]